MLYSQYGSGVNVSVGEGVAVSVEVAVGDDVCVGVAVGSGVAVTGAFVPQADRTKLKNINNKTVCFI